MEAENADTAPLHRSTRQGAGGVVLIVVMYAP
jgi:hypothetical protein